jgi:hypothetical protein
MMTALEYDTAVGRRRLGAHRHGWRRVMRALGRLDHDEHYSPVLCIAMLLIVGFALKSTAAIHATTHAAVNNARVEIPLPHQAPLDSILH